MQKMMKRVFNWMVKDIKTMGITNTKILQKIEKWITDEKETKKDDSETDKYKQNKIIAANRHE